MDWNQQREFRMMKQIIEELQRRVKELEEKLRAQETQRETLRLRKHG